jgi:hypothetical protein
VNEIVKYLRYKNKNYQITRSNRKNKKYKVEVKGKTIHFGAKGYSIAPSTKKGDRYCARSSGIKGTKDIMSPNFWSRLMWKCEGKKSKRK